MVASRVHPESRYVIGPSFFRYLYTRHMSGRFFNWLVRVLLLPGISDTQAGLKGFSAAAARRSSLTGFPTASDSTSRCLRGRAVRG